MRSIFYIIQSEKQVQSNFSSLVKRKRMYFHYFKTKIKNDEDRFH